MGIIICIGRIDKYIKRKHIRRSEDRSVGIWNSKGIFSRYKKEI